MGFAALSEEFLHADYGVISALAFVRPNEWILMERKWRIIFVFRCRTKHLFRDKKLLIRKSIKLD